MEQTTLIKIKKDREMQLTCFQFELHFVLETQCPSCCYLTVTAQLGN